jgi:uncharacterized membrane-anchored protein YhcB (DUF1043 family)
MRRNWLIGAVVLGVVAIVVAALVMRLTEDEPPTTQEWADEICSSLSDWRTSITSLADVGGEPLTADTLRDRLSDAEDATSDLVQNLRDLGPPDLEAGDELESELDDATAELEASFDALKESADEAADAPASEFLGELADLASDFAALQAAIAETVTTLQDADVAEESKAELQQAFAESSSCQALQADDG